MEHPQNDAAPLAGGACVNDQNTLNKNTHPSTPPPQGVPAWAWEKIARADGGRWAIAERDATGEVIGTAYRDADGGKTFAPRGKRGLILSWPLDPYAGSSAENPVCVMEGASDTGAMLGLALDAVGVPMAGHCGEMLAELLTGRHVVIVADADDAGRRGAGKLAAALVPVCLTVRIIEPPEGAKDARAAVIAGADARAFLILAKSAAPVTAADVEQADAVTVNMERVQAERVEWLWQDRIPLGKISMIGGDPDVGKTFLSADIAARVTTGAPWPDQPGVTRSPGGVLFINGEDGLGNTIRPRLLAAGANLSRVHAVPLLGEKGAKSRRWFTLADIPTLEKAIKESPDCRLVLIDPAGAFMGDKDENGNGDVRGLLGPLADVASRYNVAIVLVSHPSKATGRRAIHRLLGSVGWVGAARAVWCVILEHGNEKRRLFLKVKNNLAKNSPGLAYTIAGEDEAARVVWEPGFVEMTADEALAAQAGGNAGRSAVDEAEDWLRMRLSAGPQVGRDVEQDAERAGIRPKTLERARSELRVVCKPNGFGGPWLWSLPARPPSVSPESATHGGMANTGETGGTRYGPGPDTPEWAKE